MQFKLFNKVTKAGGIGSMLAVSMLLTPKVLSQTPDGDWKEIWRDDFNGTSLNTANWNIETNNSGGGNWELQYYGQEGLKVKDGNLVITASRDPRGGRQFTSGRINSKGKVFFSHGKLEARIMVPKTKGGLWPAFWMLGENINKNPWPQCGEIDILEMGNANGFGGNEETYFGAACHWGYFNSNNTYPMFANAGNAPYSLQDGEYHLFSCVWDEDAIKMYLDKDKNPDIAPYYEMSLTDKNTATSPGNYLHKPFHILFNLAVGGSFTGLGEPGQITASMPAEMKIDWVRICQPENDEAFTFCKDFVENEENQEDPYTKPGLWGTRSLNSDGESTFDFDKADDFVLIGTSAGVADIIRGRGKNIKADYNVDDVNNFFYIWEGTYNEAQPEGPNSFGLDEPYVCLEVGSVGWSGAGYASTGGKGKDLSMIDDDYILHFAMKGNDITAHRKQTLMVGNTQFVIGAADGSDPALGDYPRDGQWYSFDIPVKVLRTLKDPIFSNPSNYFDNVVAFLSGGFGGAKLQVDNVFFYRALGEVKDVPDTDTETEIGRYASKSLENGVSTFDFENSYDFVPIAASDAARGAMEGKMKLDLNVDGGNTAFYNWLYEYTTTPTYDELPQTGTNSMGEDDGYFALAVHGEQPWSGCGFLSLKPQDLSFLDDSYWLHFAMKGNDVLMHASQTIHVGNAMFIIGSGDGVTPALGDYRRDGEWYSFDIPLKDLLVISNPLFKNEKAFTDNIITLSTGGVPGATLQFDNIFFYRNDKKGANDYVDDTPCGPYVHKALDENGKSTFDFQYAEDIIPINMTEGTRAMFEGKIRADYNVDDKDICFYVWENTYNAIENPKGPNSFGFDETFPALSVGAWGWSGAAYKFEAPKDLSIISEPDYYLHLAIRSSDYMSHTPYKMGLCEDAVWITAGLNGDGILTDFPRTGEWYYIDIPVSRINEEAGHNIFASEKSFTKNLLHFDCGAREGVELHFDNVFFWRNTNPRRNDNLDSSSMNSIFEDSPTASTIRGIYTIDGRRLSANRNELAPGLYIIDGHKVLIRK